MAVNEIKNTLVGSQNVKQKVDDQVSHISAEQLIFASGPKHSVWSTSEGFKENDLENYVLDVISRLSDNSERRKGSYTSKQFKTDRLKPGAKLHGIFKKHYRDKDYIWEEREVPVFPEVHVVKGDPNGRLEEQCEYDDDFRDNPQDAPSRTGYAYLNDGRLVVCRVAYINKLYSDTDFRNGNFFRHAFVFPEGTDICQIDIDKLPFRFGLTRDEWDKAPDYLPLIDCLQKKPQVDAVLGDDINNTKANYAKDFPSEPTVFVNKETNNADLNKNSLYSK